MSVHVEGIVERQPGSFMQLPIPRIIGGTTARRRLHRAALAAALVALPVVGIATGGFERASAAAVTVTGTAFVDSNRNGAFDGAEVGLANVVVTAYSAAGGVVGTDTTAADGTYSINTSAIDSDPVRVEFSGLDSTHVAGPSAGGKQVQFLTGPGPSYTAVNFDIESLCGGGCSEAEIGDRVWNDTDGDGIQDADEAPRPGVCVELWGIDQGTLADIVIMDTQITDAQGYYLFRAPPLTVTAGNRYKVKFTGFAVSGACTSPAPFTGLTISPNHTTSTGQDGTQTPGSGLNNLRDSDCTATTEIAIVTAPLNLSDPTYDHSNDCGFFTTPSPTTTTSTSTTTTAPPSTTTTSTSTTTTAPPSTTTTPSVTTSAPDPTTTTPVASTTTPSATTTTTTTTTPTVIVLETTTTTQSAATTTTAPAATTTPPSPTTTPLASTTPPTLSATTTIPLGTCRLSDITWADANANGVLDPGEKLLSGVTVQVTGPDGTIRTQVADGQGHYVFVGLPCGAYAVDVVGGLPPGTLPPPRRVVNVLGEQLTASDQPVAFTGANSAALAALALTVLGFGGFMVTARRRRTQP